MATGSRFARRVIEPPVPAERPVHATKPGMHRDRFVIAAQVFVIAIVYVVPTRPFAAPMWGQVTSELTGNPDRGAQRSETRSFLGVCPDCNNGDKKAAQAKGRLDTGAKMAYAQL